MTLQKKMTGAVTGVTIQPLAARPDRLLKSLLRIVHAYHRCESNKEMATLATKLRKISKKLEK